jgi:RsiW-degrading membrane proteinase PrsW (M82 family)
MCLSLSWATGTGWYALHRWVRIAGDFGDEHSPWERTLLQVHGASAMLMMVYYGYILATHVHAGWRSRRNRLSGLILLSALAFMIVSAYGLYYIGGEDLRAVVSLAHLIVGFSLPLVIGVHVWSAK